MREFRELFKYGTWANVRLVDYCAGLPQEALEATAAGTFGPIPATFAHMLDQERWGLWVLKRKVGEFDQSWDSIRSTFLRHGELWQEVFDHFVDLTSTPLPPKDQWESPIPEFPLMYALQTVHHQELHRTQITSTLGSIDALPEEKDSIDVWAYWEHTPMGQAPVD